MDPEKLFTLIESAFPSARRGTLADRATVSVETDRLLAFMEVLRDDPALRFDLLVSHTAIDRMDEQRIDLVYILDSTSHGHNLFVTTRIDRNHPVAPSVCGIWPIAEWQEREVYDLMGVLYDEHPDLRRMFLEDDWIGFPLRKDYQDDHMLELPK
jgi:NADH-quinone oxidoreductase subunit C